jgi:hypothetical protein
MPVMVYIYGHGIPGGALNLNSTGYLDHGRYGDLPLQGKIPTAEPGIKPGTSWLVVKSSGHQTTRLVHSFILYLHSIDPILVTTPVDIEIVK